MRLLFTSGKGLYLFLDIPGLCFIKVFVVAPFKRMLLYYRHISIFMSFHVSVNPLLLPCMFKSLRVWEWRRYIIQRRGGFVDLIVTALGRNFGRYTIIQPTAWYMGNTYTGKTIFWAAWSYLIDSSQVLSWNDTVGPNMLLGQILKSPTMKTFELSNSLHSIEIPLRRIR